MVGGLARRRDRALDVLGTGVGDLGEFSFGRRLDVPPAAATYLPPMNRLVSILAADLFMTYG